ncbi:MAG: ribonuclease Y [Phycisphaerales bacterium]
MPSVRPLVNLLEVTTVPTGGGGDGVLLAVAVVVSIAAGIAIGVVGARFLVGISVRKAREEGERIVELARRESQAESDRVIAEARQRVISEREAFESDVQRRRDELHAEEREMSKRESKLERLLERAESRQEELDKRHAEVESLKAGVEKSRGEVAALLERRREELTRVAGMSEAEARQELLRAVEDDARDDAARLVRTITEEAQAKGRERAMEITIQAMQRYAGEHVSESTVRTVDIPSDDVKGRIIGREGRNIRAIEKASGVDLIVDDTPGVILVSCFDRVRQAIAVEAMNRLIADGRIHPTRVEEVFAKVKSEFDERIEKHGKDAVAECKLRNVHQKIVEAMGRLQYRTSYGQNVLAHSLEVAFIAQMIADQLGLDGRLARRCGFLHDIGKAMDHEMEGGHPAIGMEFARQFGEREEVLNAIGGHHGDIPSTSWYTPIVMTADALSGARPGARRESLEHYIKRLEQLQDIAKSYDGVEEAHAIQAGREVRVMVNARKISDDNAFMIAKQIADRVSEEMTFPGEVKVTVLRETRAVEIAR